MAKRTDHLIRPIRYGKGDRTGSRTSKETQAINYPIRPKPEDKK